jgi:hypothetical protein
MDNHTYRITGAILIMVLCSVCSYSQIYIPGADKINSPDFEAYISFLASPSMNGRSNGEKELDIAVNYLASQAKLIGLKPANGSSYFQPYSLMKKSIDRDRSEIKIFTSTNDSIQFSEPMYQFLPTGATDF